MKRRVLLATVLSVLTQPLAGALPGVTARFGVLTSAGDGAPAFVETTQVPNVPGQAYGWIAQIDANAKPVSWSEELTLPSAAHRWDGTQGRADVAVSSTGTAAITRGTISPGETEFHHFWAVAPGDPSGKYRVVVRVSDGVVAEFAFDVVSPNERPTRR